MDTSPSAEYPESALPPPPPRLLREQARREAGRDTPAMVQARSVGRVALTLAWLGGLIAVALIFGPRLSLVGPAANLALLTTIAAGLVVAGVLLRRVRPVRDLLFALAVPLVALGAWGALTLAEILPSARAVPNDYVGRYSTPEEEAGVQWGPNAVQQHAALRARQRWRIGIATAAMLAAVALAWGTRSRFAAVVAAGCGWLAGCDLLAWFFGASPPAFWLTDAHNLAFALGSAIIMSGVAIVWLRRWRIVRAGAAA